ncbi:hypothetical protein Tco_0860500 [Tanacetum coccineum]|uniref:Uncharacterized protein n=1 Tax=Tanacetum coccineum TaxID=301880 RepID=A0ABQ5BIW2_9ASTR
MIIALSGMFYKKNFDFAELIWEDFQYQIDYRQSKLKSLEIMPYLRFTKIFVNYFLSQHKSLAKKRHSYINTIKDDGFLSRLKFVGKGEKSQVYGLPIPDTMLIDEIKVSEAYQMYVSLSTGLVPLKKGRGKGDKRKGATTTPKNNSSIFADDNIIPEPDPTNVEESGEFDGEPANRTTGRRRPTSVVFRDTSNVSQKKSLDQSQKLNGIQVMSEEEQLAADTKKAIKASKEAHRIQQQTGDSSEGAGITPEVIDESTKNSQPQVKELVSYHRFLMRQKAVLQLKLMLQLIGVQKITITNDDKSIDIEETDNERSDKDQTEEEQANDDQAQEDQTEDDIVGTLVTMSKKEKPEVPPSSSSCSLSSNYGNQFLNVSSDTSLVGIIKDHADIEINSCKFEAWTKVDHYEAIEALVQANVINEVKNQLPKVVKDLVESRMESTVRNVLQKDPINMEKRESQKDASEIYEVKLEHASKQK